MAIETAYATAHDKADWLPLWQAYLAFYKNPLPDDVTDLTFARFLDDREQMVLLVARDGDQMVGFATVIQHHSTWAKHGYIYLEDLFVTEKVRGKGVGRKLIAAVVAHAQSEHCERVYWVTHHYNQTARRLYDSVAAEQGFVTYIAAMPGET